MVQEQRQEQRQSLDQRVRWLILDADREPLETFLAMLFVVWPIILLLPGPVFRSGPLRLPGLAPNEALLGMMTGLLFCGHVFSIAFHWPRLRAVMLLGIWAWWFQLALMFLLVKFNLLALLVVGMFAFGQGWTFLRYVGNHARE